MKLELEMPFSKSCASLVCPFSFDLKPVSFIKSSIQIGSTAAWHVGAVFLAQVISNSRSDLDAVIWKRKGLHLHIWFLQHVLRIRYADLFPLLYMFSARLSIFKRSYCSERGKCIWKYAWKFRKYNESWQYHSKYIKYESIHWKYCFWYFKLRSQ